MDNHSDSNLNTPDPPEPVIKTKTSLSLVWLIPLITALFGGWLIVKAIMEKGTEITIIFKTAEGIEAGKTKIKYKEIEIGVVNTVHFNDDFSSIIIKAEIKKEAETFLKRDTRFWVVRPQLSLREASGLGTLVSGTYIEIEPGQGATHKYFIGLDQAPVVKAETAGIKIVLLTEKLGSIDRGSHIYYQGIEAGEVLGYELGNDLKSIFIYAFIKAQFAEIIQSNTKFWNVSGMDVSVSADGIKIRTESVQTLMFGGIAFSTSESQESAKDDISGLIFTLHESLESMQENSYTKKMIFVLYFEGSVRGLKTGAPVELKGIKVGSVININLEFNSQNSTFRIPVLIELEPERIINRQEHGSGEILSPYDIINDLIDAGLRARLQTGSLLTGKLFVELDMHPEIPINLVNAMDTYPELPTIPASMKELTASVKSILGNVEKLLEKPELKDAVHYLTSSLSSLKSIMDKLDHSVDPLTDNLDKTIGAGRHTLEKLQDTLTLFNQMLMPDSPMQYNINQLTGELSETARSIRFLLDTLERNPNSIIFGKKSSGEKQ